MNQLERYKEKRIYYNFNEPYILDPLLTTEALYLNFVFFSLKKNPKII
jgi:hypothetical protein